MLTKRITTLFVSIFYFQKCQTRDIKTFSVASGKGDLFDIRLEFLVLPFPVDDQPPAFTVLSQAASRKGSHEDEFLRVLGQVDEAPGPGDAAVEFRDIDIAHGVDFRQAQGTEVKASAVTDVEHVGHLQFRFGIDSGPHIEARQRDAADNSRIGRQGQARPEALFSGDRADDFRDADTQVHDVALLQFHGGPAGTDFAVIQGMWRQGLDGLAPFAAQFRPVAVGRKALDVVLRPRHDDVIDEEMVDLHEPRIETAPRHNVFDLADDDAAGIMRRFGHFQLFTDHGFALEGNIAVFVGQGAADEADLDGKGWII